MSVFRKFLKDHDVHDPERERVFENNLVALHSEFDIFVQNSKEKIKLVKGETIVGQSYPGLAGRPERCRF